MASAKWFPLACALFAATASHAFAQGDWEAAEEPDLAQRIAAARMLNAEELGTPVTQAMRGKLLVLCGLAYVSVALVAFAADVPSSKPAPSGTEKSGSGSTGAPTPPPAATTPAAPRGSLAAATPIPILPPSENAGRRGFYRVTTAHPDVAYWVFVPDTYSEDKPAGLHLFFHGAGIGYQVVPREMSMWSTYVLHPHNLIGLSPECRNVYADFDAKMEAVKRAIGQLLADYKIIAGRGIIAGGSAGGAPCGWFLDTYAGRTPQSAALRAAGHRWPFSHVTTYGGVYRQSAAGHLPMTWNLVCGQVEWTLASIGPLSAQHMKELAGEMDSGGTMDVNWIIVKDKGHTVVARDVEATAMMFARSDLAFAPFIYLPDSPEKELAVVTGLADRLEIGKALTAVEDLLARKDLSASWRTKVRQLDMMLEERVYNMTEQMRKLSVEDPALAGYYGKVWVNQLAGHKLQNTMQGLLDKVVNAPGYEQAVQAHRAWMSSSPDLFTAQGEKAFILPRQMAEARRMRDMAPPRLHRAPHGG